MRKLTFPILLCLIASCGTERIEHEVKEPIELSADELKDKSLDELEKIRDEIFARKGYIFNSIELHKHFSTYDWYEPKYKNVDSLLSEMDRKKIQTVLELESKKKADLKRRVIRMEESELAKYRNAVDSVGKRGKQFMYKLFQTIEQFSDRPADTTILTIGNIDGVGTLDTVNTHVYALDDTIYVDSKWSRNGELMWNGKIKNPYLHINNDAMFAYETRHPWVVFTIAVNYGAPELSNREDHSGIDRATALRIGKWHIKSEKLNISQEEYNQYFDSFKGQLFMFGDPESRVELLQWYEPKKMFIRYYAP